MKYWLLILCLLASPCLAQPSTGYASATPDAPSTDGETGFTFIVDLSDMPASWWSAAEDTDATRGRAYRNDGTTRLPCDWVAYNHAGQTGWLRFKDTAALSPTTYRIYPPVSGNSTVARDEGTYGQDDAYDANWKGYWPGGLTDRTSSGNDLTAVGSPSTTTGKVNASCYTFNGSSQYLNKDTTPNIPTGNSKLTLMAWVDDNGGVGNGWYLGIGAGSTNNATQILKFSSAVQFSTWGAGVANSATAPSGPFEHVVGVYDQVNNTLYVNGTQSAQTGQTTNNITQANLRIGVSPATSFYLTGAVDEAQVHATDRSAEWIAYEYAQTNDNAAFWNTWTWNAGSSGPAINPISDSIPGSSLDPIRTTIP